MSKLLSLTLLLLGSIFLFADYKDYIYKKTPPSFNNFGQTGLLQLPSAETQLEASVYVSFTRNDIYKFGAMTVSPFDWLEASYFYYRPYDVYWFFDPTEAAKGLFLDKGFNVKFKYQPNSRYLPENIAVGLDDFSGTGLFTKQFVVATHDFRPFKVTLGLGTGTFSTEAVYTIADNLKFGELGNYGFNSENYSLGGSLTYDLWFRGKRSFFGGIEYKIPYFKGVTLKLENDPFNYFSFLSPLYGLAPEAKFLREKDSNINFGINIPFFDSSSIQFSYFKGNTFSFSFVIGANFKKPFFKKKRKNTNAFNKSKAKNSKLNFYEDLLFNLNQRGLYLQSAEIEDKKLKVAIAQASYNDPIESSLITSEIANNVMLQEGISSRPIEVTNINANQEINKIVVNSSVFQSPLSNLPSYVDSNIYIESGDTETFLNNDFKPNLSFPRHTFGWTPILLNHIGDPIKFYHGGLALRIDHDVAFSRRLTLNSQYSHMISDQFDNKRYSPRSELEHVRTDLVRYLQNQETSIPRMQLNYIWSPYQNIYTKFSGGILETMFAGAGGEVLFKPFNRDFVIGAELYKVRQRAYDQLFKFRDYSTVTGHISFLKTWYPMNVTLNLSAGQYLAGDRGYTFDVSRKTRSGFRAGFFFTRTNVSAELFGEGSFDKGFYFQLPIDLFLNTNRAGNFNFKLRPLTRDGGQKLQQGSDLIGIFHNASLGEIERYRSIYGN